MDELHIECVGKDCVDGFEVVYTNGPVKKKVTRWMSWVGSMGVYLPVPVDMADARILESRMINKPIMLRS